MEHPNNELKSPTSIFFKCIIVNIGALTSGIFFSSFNASFFQMLSLYADPHTDQKLLIASLTSAIPLGGVLGGIVACLFALRLGRRKLMMALDLLTVIACIVGQSPFLSVALVGRTICGFKCGANFLLVPLYVRELLPYYMITRTVIFFKVMFSLGMCLSFLIGLISQQNGNEQNLWKLIFLLPIFLAFIRLLGLVSCVKTDTATFYMKMNRNDKAWEVLKDTYKDQFVDEAYVRERKMSIMFRFKDAFTREYRSQVIRALIITLFAQLMGGHLLTFYSSKLFLGHQAATNDQIYIDIQTLNLFVAFITLFANLPGSIFLHKIGRRPILIYGSVILGASSLLIAFSELVNFIIGQNSLIIIFAIVQHLTFNLVSRAYAYELLPSYSLVFQVVFEMIGASCLGFVFAYLEIELAFVIVAAFCALGFLVSFKIVRETKDMTPTEIHSVFKPDDTKKKEKTQALLDEEASLEGDTKIESVKAKEPVKSDQQEDYQYEPVLLR